MNLYTIGKYSRPLCDGLGVVVVYTSEESAGQALDDMTTNGVDTHDMAVWPVRVRD